MSIRSADAPREHGQVIVLFAGALVVIVLFVGLVVDGGYAFAQRRAAQNAADFAAMAGARIVAEWISGDTTNGTDTNVKEAISTAISTNGATAIAFGSAGDPQYVNASGVIIPSADSAASYVGNGTIPTGSAGVKVGASRSWRPFFLGVAGITDWTAGASATAKGGYAAGGPSGTIFPAGIASAFFQTYGFCSGPVSADPTSPCYPKHLTPGSLNVPGGFGWLKFGCAGYGLGQNGDGCENNSGFLEGEMGPPGNSYGCCTKVGLAGSLDHIGSLPGNKVSVSDTCDYYIEHEITLTVPVWDTAGGSGSNAWYHIIGYAGFQITACNGGKDISGIWRKAFFTGPTTATPPGFAGAPLAVQLVK